MKFDGEFFANERNGKGKEYDNNGKLIFEGEYSYRKILKGKEYDKEGKLIFEGDYN